MVVNRSSQKFKTCGFKFLVLGCGCNEGNSSKIPLFWQGGKDLSGLFAVRGML
jgi:hypothetical protein